MKAKIYFVILNHAKEGVYLPLTDDKGKLIMFETETEALVAVEESLLGRQHGFEIFELGGGEISSVNIK